MPVNQHFVHVLLWRFFEIATRDKPHTHRLDVSRTARNDVNKRPVSRGIAHVSGSAGKHGLRLLVCAGAQRQRGNAADLSHSRER
jgi:hypothetical protein